MSAASAFASPVVRKVGDRDVTFKRLCMAEYGVLESTVMERKREVERAILNECQIVGKERAEALRVLEARGASYFDVASYLDTSAGTRKAIFLSLGNNAAAAEEVLAVIPFGEANILVGELAGMRDVPPDPPKAGATGTQTPPASEPQVSIQAV